MININDEMTRRITLLIYTKAYIRKPNKDIIEATYINENGKMEVQ